MVFPHTAICFHYHQKESHASDYQIGMLLKGFGYLLIGSCNGHEEGTRIISGYRVGAVPLDGNQHEIDAICAVIGQTVPIDYYRLQATEQVTHTENGELIRRTHEITFDAGE